MRRWVTSRTVVLVGHSKGGVDAAAACALYKKELAGIVRGIVVTQCPYGGSPVATDLLGTKALEGLTATALERVTNGRAREWARVGTTHARPHV